MAKNLRVGISIGAALTSGFRSAFGSARSTTDRLGQTADSLGRRHERLGRVMARAMAHPTRNVGALRQQYERLGQTLERVRDRQQRLAASQARGAALADARKNVRGQMLETAGHGIAIAAPVVASVKTAMGFEAAMSKVKALSGATAEQMDLMRNQAKELGKSTQFSASNVAAGQSFLSMAGFTPESIKEAMPGILDLAAAGDIDIASAADISSNIMSGFKLESDQSGRAADVLAKAATSANVDLGMLGETMKYVGPAAAEMGVSLEQTAAMTGVLGDAGIQGSSAGTALRAGFQRLASPPKAAAEALAQFGIATKDAQGNMRDMPDLLKEVAEKTKDMGSGDRMGWLSKVFGVEASSAFSVLLDKASNGELEQKITELESSAGTANRIATIMNDNAQGRLKEMGSALEGAAISIGEIFLPVVGQIAGYVGSAATALDNFASANPGVVKSVVLVGGALLGLKVGFLAARYAGLLMSGQLNSVATGYHMVRSRLLLLKAASQGGTFSRLTTQFRVLGNTLRGNVTRGATMASRAITVMGRAMLASPVGVAVAAIAVSAFLLIKYWKPIKAFFAGLWQGLKEGLAPVTEAFSGAFSAWAGMLSPLKPLWDGISGALGVAFGWLGKLFSPLDATAEQLEGATSAGKKVGLMLAGLIGFFPKLIANFSAFGGRLVSRLVGGISSALTAVKDVFVRTTSNVRGFLGRIWSEISSGMRGGIGGIAAMIVNFSPLGLFYRAFAGVLSWFGVGLPQTFSEFGSGLIGRLVSGVRSAFSAVTGAFARISSSIKGALGGIWSEVRAGVGGGLGGIAAMIVNFSPLGLFYRAFAGVLNWFGVDLPKTFAGFGANLIGGLIGGLKNKLTDAKESIVGFGSNVKGWFASTLGIKSPSRVFAGYGDNISEGVAMGLGRSKGLAAGGAAALALATTSAFGSPQMPAVGMDDVQQTTPALISLSQLKPEQRVLPQALAPAQTEQRQLVQQQLQPATISEEALELTQRQALSERVTQAVNGSLTQPEKGGEGGMTITFAPNIQISGAADPAAVRTQVTEATQLSYVEFERMMRRYESDRRRRSYSSR